MGTRTLALANFVLILQVVLGDHPASPAGANTNQWQELGSDLKDAADKKLYFMQGKPISLRAVIQKPEKDNNLDDVYESQIPLPPTLNDMMMDTSSGYPADGKVFSGAGHLETNEIVKNVNLLPKKSPNANVKTNNLDISRAAPGKEAFTFPELDKAVERAVNNLPTTEESPLVPLIKAFSKRVKEQSADKNISPEKKFLQKQIILKLSNKVQKKNEEDIRPLSQDTGNSQFEGNSEESEDQPCGCEDGCGEEPVENQKEGSLRGNQVGEQNEQADRTNKKLLAHIIFMIRKPRIEEESNIQARPSMHPTLSRDGTELHFRPRRYPSLAHVVLSATSSRSISTNDIPTSPFDDEEVNHLSHESPLTGMAGCDDKVAEDEREHDKSVFPFMESNRPQTPKEFLFLRYVNNLMKEKAAANAFRDNHEGRLPQMFPLPAFEKTRKDTVQAIPRLMVIKPNSQLLQPQLPPLHFPEGNSGYKIKHGGMYRFPPQFDQFDQGSSDSLDEPRLPLLPLKNVQDEEERKELPQLRNDNPEDIPWFIKNMIAHLSRNALEGRIQPIPSQPTPRQNPEEEKSPVILRAILAPFAL